MLAVGAIALAIVAIVIKLFGGTLQPQPAPGDVIAILGPDEPRR